MADEWERAGGVSGETGIHRNGGSLSSSYHQSPVSRELVKTLVEKRACVAHVSERKLARKIRSSYSSSRKDGKAKVKMLF